MGGNKIIEEKEKKEEVSVPEPSDAERPIYLSEFVGTLLNQPRLADVFFTVGRGKKKQRFPAHRVILAASSPLFEAMLYPPSFLEEKDSPVINENKPLEVAIQDTTADAFFSLLQCIYTDETEINSTNIAHLIAVAKKYQLEKLQLLCSAFMVADVNLDNALELFQIAPDLLGDDEFGLQFIRENSAEVFASDAILNLSKERLMVLVKDDGLGIDELDLFKVIQKWGKNKLKEKDLPYSAGLLKDELKDILQLIRFPTMDVSSIAAFVAPCGLLEPKQLLSLFKYVSISDEKTRKAIKMDFPTKARSGGVQYKDSKILVPKQSKDVLSLFGKKTKSVKLELLYRGSRDGFTGPNFHSKCDGKGPTFTVCEATSGNILGGYFGGDWSGSGSYNNTDDAWIYSLKNKSGKVVKFLPSGTNHVYCHNGYGPTWGGGHDLHVNTSMTSNSNYCNPNSYKKSDPEFPVVNYDNSLLAGAYNWTVKEIEVFKVVKK